MRGADLESLGIFAVEGFVSITDETMNTLHRAGHLLAFGRNK